MARCECAPMEEIKQVQTKFIWVINNFEEKARVFKKIASTVFTTFVDQIIINWQLIMTFGAENGDDEELVGIFIRCLDNYHFRLTLQFSILDINNKEVNICSFRNYASEAGRYYGLDNFIKTRELLTVKKLNFLNEGNLTIIVTITTNRYIDIEEYNNEEDQRVEVLRLEKFEHSLNFLRSGTLSDVVFSVEGKEIHANKGILANTSPVFQAMFTNDMAEACNNSVVVEDITYSAMYDLFKFIYSGAAPECSEQERHKTYLSLLMAANKYDIKNLKLYCEIEVSSNLKIDNVFDTLKVADTHNALILKERAIQFIASNAEE